MKSSPSRCNPKSIGNLMAYPSYSLSCSRKAVIQEKTGAQGTFYRSSLVVPRISGSPSIAVSPSYARLSHPLPRPEAARRAPGCARSGRERRGW